MTFKDHNVTLLVLVRATRCGKKISCELLTSWFGKQMCSKLSYILHKLKTDIIVFLKSELLCFLSLINIFQSRHFTFASFSLFQSPIVMSTERQLVQHKIQHEH